MAHRKQKNKSLFLASCLIGLVFSCQREIVYFTETPTLTYLDQVGLAKSTLSELAKNEGFSLTIKVLGFDQLGDLGASSIGGFAIYSPLLSEEVTKGKAVFPMESDFIMDDELFQSLFELLSRPKKAEIYFDQNLVSFSTWVEGFKDFLKEHASQYDMQPAQVGIFDSLKQLDSSFDAILIIGEINDPQILKILAEGTRPWVGSFIHAFTSDNNLRGVLVPDYGLELTKILEEFKKSDDKPNFDLKNTRLRLIGK